MSKVKNFGTKQYIASKYFLRPGKKIKYFERGEERKEHIYEVEAMYSHCILLQDVRDGTRICPGYNTLSLMLNEVGAINE